MTDVTSSSETPLEVLVLEQSPLTTWERETLQIMKTSNLPYLNELSQRGQLKPFIARMGVLLETEFNRLDAEMPNPLPSNPAQTLPAMSHHLQRRMQLMAMAVEQVLPIAQEE